MTTTYFDSGQLIDIGSAPNANDGDTLRIAGAKINTIAQSLDSALDALDSDFRQQFDSNQIADGSISTDKIQDGAINADKLSLGSLDNGSYAGSLNFDSTAPDNVITILPNGNVGINDSDPGNKFQVTGSTGSATAKFYALTEATINLQSGDNISGPFRMVSSDNAFFLKSQNTGISIDQAFLKYDEPTNSLRLMNNVNIDASNNVGIGKAPSSYGLDVNGSIQSTNSGGTSGVLLNSSGAIEIANTGTEAYIDFKNAIGDDYDIRVQATTAGDFEVLKSGSVNNLFTVKTNGSVGVGIDLPTDKLHVADGTVRSEWTAPAADVEAFRGQSSDTSVTMLHLQNSTGNVQFRKDNGFSSIRLSDASDLRFYHNNVWKYQFQADGDFVATGDITAFGSLSDKNLKENIENIPNALEKVSQLNGVTFNYIGSKESMTGVIAQEVQEVLPEVIYETVDNTREDGRALAVRYGNMVGLLIEAIKELKVEIEDLKNNV